jgi:predicted RND superfamily exporter protein
MAPTPDYHALDHSTILRRSLTNVNHTQAVTLGIIAVYVVVIALLWNLPYVRWSLWPFKVFLFSISLTHYGCS